MSFLSAGFDMRSAQGYLCPCILAFMIMLTGIFILCPAAQEQVVFDYCVREVIGNAVWCQVYMDFVIRRVNAVLTAFQLLEFAINYSRP